MFPFTRLFREISLKRYPYLFNLCIYFLIIYLLAIENLYRFSWRHRQLQVSGETTWTETTVHRFILQSFLEQNYFLSSVICSSIFWCAQRNCFFVSFYTILYCTKKVTARPSPIVKWFLSHFLFISLALTHRSFCCSQQHFIFLHRILQSKQSLSLSQEYQSISWNRGREWPCEAVETKC